MQHTRPQSGVSSSSTHESMGVQKRGRKAHRVRRNGHGRWGRRAFRLIPVAQIEPTTGECARARLSCFQAYEIYPRHGWWYSAQPPSVCSQYFTYHQSRDVTAPQGGKTTHKAPRTTWPFLRADLSASECAFVFLAQKRRGWRVVLRCFLLVCFVIMGGFCRRSRSHRGWWNPDATDFPWRRRFWPGVWGGACTSVRAHYCKHVL